jgi:hypothetical protein
MGTRSTTKIYDGKNLILSLYKQYDGYVEGWGKELKDFIKSGDFVNGFGLENKKRQFNGIGCFALQLVCEFKDGVGGLYATSKNDEQEYNYKITYKYSKKKNDTDKIIIECEEDEDYYEEFDLGTSNYR